ncbi:MAG: ATP synthase subunit I [Actinobacteria bacterium]|nr:ATP synthase subunit I [Actinomycetota bacterium]
MTDASVLVGRDLGPATEREVAGDLVRRGALAAPVALLPAGLVWGWAGVASVGLATAIVLANFWLSAALLAWAARISLGLVMAVALFGFLVRMALVAGIVLAVRHQPWLAPWPLGLALIVSHLGLLAWETRYVSASLAFPGLKPAAAKE